MKQQEKCPSHRIGSTVGMIAFRKVFRRFLEAQVWNRAELPVGKITGVLGQFRMSGASTACECPPCYPTRNRSLHNPLNV